MADVTEAEKSKASTAAIHGEAKAAVHKKPRQTSSKRAKKKKTKRASSEDGSSAKGLPWTFPKNSLEDSIRIAKAIEDKNAGNPMPSAALATAVGYRLAQDWRYQDLLRSANQYGLTTGTGASASIGLAKFGQDIVAPSSPAQRTEGLIAAFRNVKDFAEVEKFYGGKKIPEDEFFLNTLNREFAIPRDRVETFSKVFTENLRYLRAFRSETSTALTSETGATEPNVKSETPVVQVVSKEPRGREFLDTCFVMMPFGTWFDRYYQEIYIPAIKDAGLEPVRADELFTTGSVVEQIWEEINKAKLLLADLSGKNANVFYELGLAHAACKPVIFTASNTGDVPFDLRHLRVIIYEVQEPDWGNKLRKQITDYLKNAAREPEKSIPHPFRAIATAELQSGPKLSKSGKP
jgi:hypothetical protein